MTNQHDFMDVIAALVDAERVAPDRLRDALAVPDGRDYFVDLLAMREVVASGSAAPRCARAPGLSGDDRLRRSRPQPRSLSRYSAAIAIDNSPARISG